MMQCMECGMGGGRKRVCEIERDTEKQKGMVREGEQRDRERQTQRNRKTERETDRGREGQCVC